MEPNETPKRDCETTSDSEAKTHPTQRTFWSQTPKTSLTHKHSQNHCVYKTTSAKLRQQPLPTISKRSSTGITLNEAEAMFNAFKPKDRFLFQLTVQAPSTVFVISLASTRLNSTCVKKTILGNATHRGPLYSHHLRERNIGVVGLRCGLRCGHDRLLNRVLGNNIHGLLARRTRTLVGASHAGACVAGRLTLSRGIVCTILQPCMRVPSFAVPVGGQQASERRAARCAGKNVKNRSHRITTSGQKATVLASTVKPTINRAHKLRCNDGKLVHSCTAAQGLSTDQCLQKKKLAGDTNDEQHLLSLPTPSHVSVS